MKDLTLQLEHAIDKASPALHQKKNISEDQRLHLLKGESQEERRILVELEDAKDQRLHEVESEESWQRKIKLKIMKAYLSLAPFIPDKWDFWPDLTNCLFEGGYLLFLHYKMFDIAAYVAKTNFLCILAT